MKGARSICTYIRHAKIKQELDGCESKYGRAKRKCLLRNVGGTWGDSSKAPRSWKRITKARRQWEYKFLQHKAVNKECLRQANKPNYRFLPMIYKGFLEKIRYLKPYKDYIQEIYVPNCPFPLLSTEVHEHKEKGFPKGEKWYYTAKDIGEKPPNFENIVDTMFFFPF